jgi:hypothetical protein
MASLNDFISSVKDTGMMRTSRYSVIFPESTALDSANANLLGMYCEQVNLPGLNIQTNPCLTYGETREMPYQRLFESITLSFYVDSNMRVKQYFDDWMIRVQNPMDRTINYYNDYVKDVTIVVEDLDNKPKYTIVLRECYPKTMNSIQLDYASKDVMKLSVTFVYRYWESASRLNNRPTYINQNGAGVSPETQDSVTGLTIQHDALRIANNEIAATRKGTKYIPYIG